MASTTPTTPSSFPNTPLARLVFFVYMPLTGLLNVLAWMKGTNLIPQTIEECLPHPLWAIFFFWLSFLMLIVAMKFDARNNIDTAGQQTSDGQNAPPTRLLPDTLFVRLVCLGYAPLTGALCWWSWMRRVIDTPPLIQRYMPSPVQATIIFMFSIPLLAIAYVCGTTQRTGAEVRTPEQSRVQGDAEKSSDGTSRS